MDGAKQRLGNVLAWIGFVALVGVLPFIFTIPGMIWEENQEEPRIRRESCLDWRDMKEPPVYDPLGLYPPGFNYKECSARGLWGVWWEYKDKSGWAYTDRYYRPQDYVPGYNRPWSDAARDFDGLVSVALPTWIVILVINYIFWGSMRILPWKRPAQTKDEG